MYPDGFSHTYIIRTYLKKYLNNLNKCLNLNFGKPQIQENLGPCEFNAKATEYHEDEERSAQPYDPRMIVKVIIYTDAICMPSGSV